MLFVGQNRMALIHSTKGGEIDRKINKSEIEGLRKRKTRSRERKRETREQILKKEMEIVRVYMKEGGREVKGE